jgi:hypothetical protein
MKTTPMILVACAALLASTVAFAEPKEPKVADANGDGMIDAQELANSGFEDKTFADVDTNSDGKITIEEYTAAYEDCE